MISTFFGQGALSTSGALLMALLIGAAFGFALERAGFGSSRRLAGIFYFRDMAVLKVMFTAVIVAMLGVLYFRAMGLVHEDQFFYLPSIFGAQIVGGLVFGVGFAVGGWCPGTAAVGVASGRWDALVFLGGATAGSMLFNETFGAIKGLYTWGDRGVQFAWQNLGISSASFALLLTLVGVASFWGSELIEKRRGVAGGYFKTPFLRGFSVALVALAAGLMLVRAPGAAAPAAGETTGDAAILASIDAATDHFEPEELADRLMKHEEGLLVVDIRPGREFDAFHIRGAVNIALPDLPASLAAHKDSGLIVLYSNGMTHPAQARDALARSGFTNVYVLTDGLAGFMDRCLRPVSLRLEPLSAAEATHVNAWRQYFSEPASLPPAAGSVPTAAAKSLANPGAPSWPGLLESSWLAANLGKPGVKILDVREQARYNTAHIPGAVCVSVENFRGVVRGMSSMLLPQNVLAMHLSLMGIEPGDSVAVVPEDKLHDATLVCIALARLGHVKYGLLNGGFANWLGEKLPITSRIPGTPESRYPAPSSPDSFTVGFEQVLEHVKKDDAVIIDVRPTEYYTGEKVEEARGGHIPGAKSRPFTEDVTRTGEVTLFKPIEELARAYARLIPTKDTAVIVHCRTGHQASQTYFVLKHLLHYRTVLWYDPGWMDWAARSELPVMTGAVSK